MVFESEGALLEIDLRSLFNSLQSNSNSNVLTALFTSGWSFRATLRYADLISDFEAERGTPRTTWAGRGDEEEEEEAAATMAERFVSLLALVVLCRREGAAMLCCRRGEGTAAAVATATASLIRSGMQRIVAREERREQSQSRTQKRKKMKEKVKIVFAQLFN